MSSEIEEYTSWSEELFEIKILDSIKEESSEESLYSYDINNHIERGDIVYVAVGKNEALSMDALVWTLKNAVNSSSSVVCLVHVFPEVHYIPTPLGKFPTSQVNPEQKGNYLIQERGKRKDFLQKFVDICSASKVNVETILIESDVEAKALLDLIPILNMRKLVLSTSKSSLRKLKSRKGNVTADQLLQNVPEFCELHIICEGNEVLFENQIIESPFPRGIISKNSSDNDNSSNISMQEQNSFTCSFLNIGFLHKIFKYSGDSSVGRASD